ncbi:hypothetical protein ACVIGA_005562 [Bradyrhizobium sp. USDA 3240]
MLVKGAIWSTVITSIAVSSAMRTGTSQMIELRQRGRRHIVGRTWRVQQPRTNRFMGGPGTVDRHAAQILSLTVWSGSANLAPAFGWPGAVPQKARLEMAAENNALFSLYM